MPVKNICVCYNPPGDTVTCEPHQLAICIVKNGIAKKDCKDPPDGIGDVSKLSPAATIRYLNWALAQITGQTRQMSDAISPADATILARGNYRNDATGERITFSLPSDLDLSSLSSASGSGSGGSKESDSRGSKPALANSGSATATY